MNWLLGIVLVYVVGGLTFVPLVVLTLWYFSPTVPQDLDEKKQIQIAEEEEESKNKGEPEGYRSLKAAEVLEKNDLNLNTYYKGWLTVTREYYQFTQIDPREFQAQGNANGSLAGGNDRIESGSSSQIMGKGLLKMMKGSAGIPGVSEEPRQDPASLDAKKLKAIRRKNRYFAVLKHGNLFLYDDEEKMNVQYVIVLSNYVVGIWPRSLKDGQLFTKKSAIGLFKRGLNSFKTSDSTEKPGIDPLADLLVANSSSSTQPPKDTFFVYADMNHQKEDWYFALLRATTTDSLKTGTEKDLLEPSFMARPLHYQTADMIDLIQTLNSSEGQLTTKWMNAFVGRMFLGFYKTDEFKSLFKAKVDEKLKKIRTPGFLDNLQIKDIDVGHSAPFIMHPKLKSISTEGDLELEMNFLYTGGFTVEVSTKVFLNLGARFKQREFDVNLRIQFKKLEGDVVVKVKPVPTSRIWYGFTKMPTMDLKIEPVVSSRLLNYNLITNIITNRFKEVFSTSLVLPFMDDLIVFKTDQEVFRGGVWDKSARPSKATVPTATASPSPTQETTSVTSSPPPLPTRDSDIVLEVPVPTGNEEELHYDDFDKKSLVSSIGESLGEKKNVTLDAVFDDVSEPTAESVRSMGSSATTVSKLKEKASVFSKKNFQSDKKDDTNREISLKEPPEKGISDSDSNELTEAAQQQQKYNISSSVNKIRGFYSTTKQKFAESSKQPSQNHTNDSEYTPPEMISNRRLFRKSTQGLPTNATSESQGNHHHRQISSEFFSIFDKSKDTAQVPEENPQSPSSPAMFISEKFRSGSINHSLSPSSLNSHQNVFGNPVQQDSSPTPVGENHKYYLERLSDSELPHEDSVDIPEPATAKAEVESLLDEAKEAEDIVPATPVFGDHLVTEEAGKSLDPGTQNRAPPVLPTRRVSSDGSFGKRKPPPLPQR